ncbi:MAG: DUF2158 domain-containing protein [Verrucomicrobia bacterium]|nr:MAG: DUF2158 domain-containing protein [Verrucomicrobiota bacterium]
MDNSELKIGDQVKLKSGGPIMTVEYIVAGTRDYCHETFMHTVWFEGSDVRKSNFNSKTLEKCE